MGAVAVAVKASKGSVSSMSTDMKDIITTGRSGGIVGPSVDINNIYAIPTVNSVPYCGKSPARRYSVRRPNDPYNPSRPAFYNDWSTPIVGPSVDINNIYAIPTVNSVPYCGKSPARRYSVRRPNDPYNPSRPAFYNDWSTPTLMDVDQCDPNAMAL